MLVLNVNNSQKMPLWPFNSPYWRMRIQNALLLIGELARRLRVARVDGLPWTIGHFRFSPDLCFKTRLGAQPLIWKSFFILMQIKLIFTTKSVHLASFWKWGFLEVAYLPPYPRGLRPKEWKRVLGWGTGQIKLFFLLYSYVAGTSFVGRRSKSPLRVFPSRGQ